MKNIKSLLFISRILLGIFLVIVSVFSVGRGFFDTSGRIVCLILGGVLICYNLIE